jgi:hypothetical protein
VSWYVVDPAGTAAAAVGAPNGLLPSMSITFLDMEIRLFSLTCGERRAINCTSKVN